MTPSVGSGWRFRCGSGVIWQPARARPRAARQKARRMALLLTACQERHAGLAACRAVTGYAGLRTHGSRIVWEGVAVPSTTFLLIDTIVGIIRLGAKTILERPHRVLASGQEQ